MRTISKPLFLPLLFLLAAAWGALDAHAAMIPQEWSVEVSRIKQYQFEANRGDTMELKATFWHKGEPFDLGGDTFRLYWQTNGMDSVYWSVPAVSASNTVSAVFANTMDPGAPIVYGFLGATSGNYRASFAIRYAPGPGAVPNALPLPVATIDFSKVVALNAPWLLPAATNDIGTIKVELGSISNNVSTNSAAIATLKDTTATLSDTTATINSKIPSAASASNQLADKEWIEDEIDTYAAYYITYTAAGAAFPTRAALLNATVVYSGGAARTPTRNDYAVVLADETHGGAEWRYIYTVAAGATSGQWDAQYPIETNDYEALSNKPSINGNELFGNKTAAQLGLATPDDVAAAVDAATNYTDSALSTSISASNADFSNAVLSVGLNIDTNAVAAINALVEQGEELPTGGAASVVALLLALAAAVAALKKRLPYALVAKTIENNAVTLDDRASNSVEISETLSPNTLTINFPAEPIGKARDFALRLNIASGVTAPELVLPQGVVCENADGEVPEISDGGTGGSSTILYFSETENNGTTAKFLLKGETLAALTQA